jgi:hypothetical protein
VDSDAWKPGAAVDLTPFADLMQGHFDAPQMAVKIAGSQLAGMRMLDYAGVMRNHYHARTKSVKNQLTEMGMLDYGAVAFAADGPNYGLSYMTSAVMGFQSSEVSG